MALALYEDESASANQEGASLQGVVPYTEQSWTDIARTYTVNEWLTAVSTDTGEIVTYDSPDDQQPCWSDTNECQTERVATRAGTYVVDRAL